MFNLFKRPKNRVPYLPFPELKKLSVKKVAFDVGITEILISYKDGSNKVVSVKGNVAQRFFPESYQFGMDAHVHEPVLTNSIQAAKILIETLIATQFVAAAELLQTKSHYEKVSIRSVGK
jgi:hypothetical protein